MSVMSVPAGQGPASPAPVLSAPRQLWLGPQAPEQADTERCQDTQCWHPPGHRFEGQSGRKAGGSGGHISAGLCPTAAGAGHGSAAASFIVIHVNEV